MKLINLIFLLLVIAVGVTFAYLNAHSVIFNYYFAEKSLPLSLLLVLAVGMGVVLALIAMLVPWLRLRSRNRKLKRKLKCVEQELENLRSIPLQKDSVC